MGMWSNLTGNISSIILTLLLMSLVISVVFFFFCMSSPGKDFPAAFIFHLQWTWPILLL